MPEYAAKRNPNRCPTHPGEILREDVIPATGATREQIYAALGISRQALYDILTEKKRLSPNMAVRIAALFGGSAESWLRMQAAYDAWHADRNIDVSKIKRMRGTNDWSKPLDNDG